MPNAGGRVAAEYSLRSTLRPSGPITSIHSSRPDASLRRGLVCLNSLAGSLSGLPAGDLRLPRHRQRVRAVDHRFALGNSPALPSAPDKNRSPASTRRSSRATPSRRPPAPREPARPEHVHRALQQSRAPLRHQVRMNVILLCRLRQCLLALHGRQRQLRLECRTVVPAWSLAHHASCAAAILAAIRPAIHSSRCPNFPNHFLTSVR